MAGVSPDAEVPEWSGERVERWLRQAAGLERQLEPVSEVLLAAAALRPGERVLDVGCGTGPTTRQAASAVGADGSVTGLDVSADMVAAARAATGDADGPVRWVVADVEAWDPDQQRWDVVLSRFGVMFFDDPPTAFARLAEATAPDGRLAVAVWARRDASALFEVPLAAALAVLRAAGVEAEEPPVDGGPFSLGDREQVTDLLVTTGWGDVGWHPHVLPLPFAGGRPPEGAAEAALDFGPTRLVTIDVEGAVRDDVRAGIATAFTDHLDDTGHVVLDGTVIVITARRGPVGT